MDRPLFAGRLIQTQVFGAVHDIGKDIDFKKLMLRILEDQSHIRAKGFFVKAVLMNIFAVV